MGQKKNSRLLSLLSNQKWFIRLVAFIIIMLIWQLIGSTTNPLFTSTPLGVIHGFGVLANGTGNFSLGNATMLTFEEMLVGFVIASVTGIGIGLSMGMWRKLDVALNPYVNALYVTPRIALIPLIIIWFGVGFSAIVFTVFLTAVFPILINTEAGVRNVSKSLLDVARVFNVQGIRRFRRVIFPATIPFTMAGLRLGVAEAFIGVIVAQMVLSLQGLGYQITTYGEFYDTPELIGTIIVLMIIGAGLTSLVQFIERKISYWKQTERAFE